MRYFLLAVILVAGIAACKQNVKGKNGVVYKSAIEYNDYIANRQTSLVKKVLELTKVMSVNLDTAEVKLKQAVSEAEEMIVEIKGMPPYKGDSALRDAAIKSFSFYKNIFENDYIDVINIYKKGEENLTREDVTEVNRIVAKISQEEAILDKSFQNAQKTYAEKNKIKLVENKMQQEVEKMGNQ